MEKPPEADKLMEFAIDMALNYLPKLGIPAEHNESASKPTSRASSPGRVRPRAKSGQAGC